MVTTVTFFHCPPAGRDLGRDVCNNNASIVWLNQCVLFIFQTRRLSISPQSKKNPHMAKNSNATMDVSLELDNRLAISAIFPQWPFQVLQEKNPTELNKIVFFHTQQFQEMADRKCQMQKCNGK